MSRSALRVVASVIMLAACCVIVGGQEPLQVREDPSVALRRAQAFHDMYATPEDKAALAARMALPATTRDGKPPRALPINYGSFDPAFRLQPLRREGEIRPGSTFSLERGGGVTRGAGPLWENLGPTNVAGRVSALVIDPSNPAIVYRGTAGGGVWQSKNSGGLWAPLTDGIGNLSIGAIAVARAAAGKPSILYVGTGEGTLGIDGIDGIGLIKSIDGGKTWSLPVSVPGRRFFALTVNAGNGDELVAGTLNGIQKSVDGGTTWKTTLPGFSATEVVRVTGAPTHLLATVWDVIGPQSRGNGFIYRSTNSGDSWTRVGGAGLQPFDQDTGRLSLAVSDKAPVTIYVLAASASGDTRNCPGDAVDQAGIYRSTDEGLTWTLRSNPVSGTCQFGLESILGGQGWYANAIRVDAANAAVVYAGGLDLWKSTDGGSSWKKQSRWNFSPASPQYVHADIHALTWSSGALLIGNDGGVQKTTDGAKTFTSLNTGIVTRQYYSIGIAPTDRALVVGGAQDNGTNIRTGATTTYREVIGGDGFGVAVDPKNPKTLYGTVYDSRVFRSRDGGVTFKEVTPKFAKGEKRPFISPLTMDPQQPATLYTGSNYLWRTIDGGDNWTQVSTTDLGDGRPRGYLTSIAIAPTDSKKLLTATGAGIVKKSTDGGAHWTPINGLPSAYASHVEFDPANADVFYVSFMSAGPVQRLLKTTNGGQSFTRIDNGLPPFPVHVMRVHPASTQTLYVGLDVGLYKSIDAGATWKAAGDGLPAVSVWGVAIFADGSSMRVATHGRGFYQLLLTAPGRSPTPELAR